MKKTIKKVKKGREQLFLLVPAAIDYKKLAGEIWKSNGNKLVEALVKKIKANVVKSAMSERI
jgi:hypothetical protein